MKSPRPLTDQLTERTIHSIVRLVARVDAATRMKALTDGGATCFARLGYQRAKVADIASAAGMSVGNVYLYVDSKEALFHLVVVDCFGGDLPQEALLPYQAPPFSETLDVIVQGLRRDGLTPRLKQAAQSVPPDDVWAELAEIVSEQYSNVTKLRRALAVIEACAADLPDLESLYFGRRRRGQIDLLVRYLERRAEEDRLQPIADLAVAAQLVHESVSWFAWKRLEGHDANRFDDRAGRQALVEFCCNAIVGPKQ